MSSRHEPYVAEEPPTDAKHLAEFLTRELRRIENHLSYIDPAVTNKWDDLRVSLETAQLGGSSDPSYLEVMGNLRAYHFGNSPADQEVFFAVQLPHAFKQQSTLHPHIHWLVKGAVSADTRVVWGLEYTYAAMSATFSTSTITELVTATCGAPYQHMLTHFPLITATLAGISSMFLCRLFRYSSLAGDNYGSAAVALEFDMHILLDDQGSYEEMYK